LSLSKVGLKTIVSQVEGELAEFGVGICYLQGMWIPRETDLIFLKDTGEWGVGGTMYTSGMYSQRSVEFC